jgi:alkylhydroperoxidase/carboxymuconolactone decarboxylase family protein YurZ
MDEKTKILISLGAATATNCIPCFEHYFGKAGSVGLGPDEIQAAAEIGEQINKGAQLAIRKTVNTMVVRGCQQGISKTNQSDKSCCG